MNKKLIILFVLALLIGGIMFLFSVGSTGTQLLWNISDEGKWLLPLVSVAALIDSINPCAFSVLLLTIAFLFSVGKLRSRILQIGGVYIFGIFTAYMLIGLGILKALHIFDTPHFISKIAAVIMLVLGAFGLINELFPAFPLKARIPTIAHGKIAALMEKATIPAALLLGILVGLCEFPCTGGPYLMVVGLLHDKATATVGFAYLLLYNILFVLPLFIILGFAGNESVLGKIQHWHQHNRRALHAVMSIAMLILGIYILTM